MNQQLLTPVYPTQQNTILTLNHSLTRTIFYSEQNMKIARNTISNSLEIRNNIGYIYHNLYKGISKLSRYDPFAHWLTLHSRSDSHYLSHSHSYFTFLTICTYIYYISYDIMPLCMSHCIIIGMSGLFLMWWQWLLNIRWLVHARQVLRSRCEGINVRFGCGAFPNRHYYNASMCHVLSQWHWFQDICKIQ